jgi:hypothetical protein
MSHDDSGRHLHPSLSGGVGPMTNLADKFFRLSQLHYEMAIVNEEIMVELVKQPDDAVLYDHPSIVSKLPDNVIPFPRNPDEF